MEPGAHGPRRYAKDVRRLVEAEPEVVVHDQHGPLVHVQPPETAFDLVAIGQFHDRVDGPGGIGQDQWIDVDFDALSPPGSARFPIARVDEQAMEPWPEAVGVTKAGQTPPGLPGFSR